MAREQSFSGTHGGKDSKEEEEEPNERGLHVSEGGKELSGLTMNDMWVRFYVFLKQLVFHQTVFYFFHSSFPIAAFP